MLTRLRTLIRRPAFLAMILAPMGTELITGNMPPFVFFFPPVLAILIVLYGGGAIIAHELIVRWGKGWPSLLALAIAYGIFEEGILVRTFFNPKAGDINPTGEYGRWFGVSWVEVLRLTTFHSVFAILIPLLLVGYFYPEQRRESWVSPRTTKILALLMLLEVPLGWAMMPYRPAATGYLICIGAMLALIGIARILPVPKPRATSGRGWERRLVVQGFLANALLFAFGWALPAIPAPAPISIAFLIGLAGFVFIRVVRGGIGTDGLLALAAGGLGFYAATGPILELAGRRGMAVVGVVAIVLLIRLSRQVQRATLVIEPAEISLAA